MIVQHVIVFMEGLNITGLVTGMGNKQGAEGIYLVEVS